MSKLSFPLVDVKSQRGKRKPKSSSCSFLLQIFEAISVCSGFPPRLPGIHTLSKPNCVSGWCLNQAETRQLKHVLQATAPLSRPQRFRQNWIRLAPQHPCPDAPVQTCARRTPRDPLQRQNSGRVDHRHVSATPPSSNAGTKLCCSSGVCELEDKTVSCWLAARIPAAELALLFLQGRGRGGQHKPTTLPRGEPWVSALQRGGRSELPLVLQGELWRINPPRVTSSRDSHQARTIAMPPAPAA